MWNKLSMTNYKRLIRYSRKTQWDFYVGHLKNSTTTCTKVEVLETIAMPQGICQLLRNIWKEAASTIARSHNLVDPLTPKVSWELAERQKYTEEKIRRYRSPTKLERAGLQFGSMYLTSLSKSCYSNQPLIRRESRDKLREGGLGALYPRFLTIAPSCLDYDALVQIL